MGDDVQVEERDAQATASGDDAPAPNGSSGSPLALPAALAVGGAVAGALAAFMGRRLSHEPGTADEERPELTDELASRASAAARGDEDEQEDVGAAYDEEVGDDAHASGEAGDGEEPPEPSAGAEPAGEEAAAEDDEGAPEAEGRADEADVEDEGEDVPPEADGRAGGDADGGDDSDGAGGGAATRVARSAARQLGELTGRDADAVLGVERDGEGWRVTLELVELSRTPSTTDVLGRYDVELDDDGEIIEYRQVDRYVRGRGGDSR